jgi:Fe2+ transport system protein B
MTWAERFGDVATRLMLVVVLLLRLVTQLIRFLFEALDNLVSRLSEMAEQNVRGADVQGMPWVVIVKQVILNIVYAVLQLLAIVTVLLRQLATTLDEFVAALYVQQESAA